MQQQLPAWDQGVTISSRSPPSILSAIGAVLPGMSVTTTSLPTNGTRAFSISKQVASFYGLPFQEAASSKTGAALSNPATITAAGAAHSKAVTAAASKEMTIPAAAAAATIPFTRPRLWNGEPSPDSLSGSSPSSRGTEFSYHSGSKNTAVPAPFQSPPSTGRLSDRKVVAQLNEWVKARMRTPGSSDSDYHLPITPSSAAAIPIAQAESQSDAADRKRMDDGSEEDVLENDRDQPTAESIEQLSDASLPLAHDPIDVLRPDAEGWASPTAASPPPPPPPPSPPIQRSFPHPAYNSKIGIAPASASHSSPPSSAAADVQTSPPLLTGDAVRLPDEEVPTGMSVDAPTQSPLFSPHNQSCPKGAVTGLRRLNGKSTSAFTAVSTQDVERIATPAIPQAPIRSEKSNNPFAAKKRAHAAISRSPDPVLPLSLWRLVLPLKAVVEHSDRQVKAKSNEVKSDISNKEWKEWLSRRTVMLQSIPFWLRKPRERDVPPINPLPANQFNPLIPIWPQTDGLTTTTSFRRDTSPIRARPHSWREARPAFGTVVDIDPAQIGRKTSSRETERVSLYKPSHTSELTFDGPWRDSNGRPDAECLAEMRALEASYRINWYAPAPDRAAISSAEQQFQRMQQDHALNELKSALYTSVPKNHIPSDSKAIEVKSRLVVVEWALGFGSNLQLPREVCHRAIHMMDRCLIEDRARSQRPIITEHNIQMLAATCLYQSITSFDTAPTWNVQDFNYLDDGTGSDPRYVHFNSIVHASSVSVLGLLQWRFVLYPTAIEWIQAFLCLTIEKLHDKPTWLFPNDPNGPWLPAEMKKVFTELKDHPHVECLFHIADVDVEPFLFMLSEMGTYHRICHLLDMALMDVESFNYAPSHLAAGAIVLTFGPRIARVVSEVSGISLDAMIAPLQYLGPLRATIPNNWSDFVFVDLTCKLEPELRANRSLCQMAVDDGYEGRAVYELMVCRSEPRRRRVAGLQQHLQQTLGVILQNELHNELFLLQIIEFFCDFSL